MLFMTDRCKDKTNVTQSQTADNSQVQTSGLSLQKAHEQNIGDIGNSDSGCISQTPSGLRRCWKCKSNLPRSNFSKDKSRKSGLQSKCKKCSNKRVHEWRHSKVADPTRPTRKRLAKRNKAPSQDSIGYLDPVRDESQLQMYLQDGLNIRNRKHLSTKQQATSRAQKLHQDELERQADELLGIKKSQRAQK
jgi:hypothetical protein